MTNKYPQNIKLQKVCTEKNCVNAAEFIHEESHWCSLHWHMWWYRGYSKENLIKEIIEYKDRSDKFESKYLKLNNKNRKIK